MINLLYNYFKKFDKESDFTLVLEGIFASLVF